MLTIIAGQTVIRTTHDRFRRFGALACAVQFTGSAAILISNELVADAANRSQLNRFDGNGNSFKNL